MVRTWFFSCKSTLCQFTFLTCVLLLSKEISRHSAAAAQTADHFLLRPLRLQFSKIWPLNLSLSLDQYTSVYYKCCCNSNFFRLSPSILEAGEFVPEISVLFLWTQVANKPEGFCVVTSLESAWLPGPSKSDETSRLIVLVMGEHTCTHVIETWKGSFAQHLMLPVQL